MHKWYRYSSWFIGACTIFPFRLLILFLFHIWACFSCASLLSGIVLHQELDSCLDRSWPKPCTFWYFSLLFELYSLGVCFVWLLSGHGFVVRFLDVRTWSFLFTKTPATYTPQFRPRAMAFPSAHLLQLFAHGVKPTSGARPYALHNQQLTH